MSKKTLKWKWNFQFNLMECALPCEVLSHPVYLFLSLSAHTPNTLREDRLDYQTDLHSLLLCVGI